MLVILAHHVYVNNHMYLGKKERRFILDQNLSFREFASTQGLYKKLKVHT